LTGRRVLRRLADLGARQQRNALLAALAV